MLDALHYIFSTYSNLIQEVLSVDLADLKTCLVLEARSVSAYRVIIYSNYIAAEAMASHLEMVSHAVLNA